ncbi:MDR family MFS transporter [Arthrobacter sp. RAF14]|uniref:MDR family MFS transporter n=1 Tax=Arthrobacter sp. RAF14 TaxID=3233051 RepID=UPI003F931609
MTSDIKNPSGGPLDAPAAYDSPPEAAQTAPEAGAPEKLSREVVVIISVLLVSTFTVFLNETIMNVALPRLMTALDVSESTVQWLSTGFMLTMAVVIPTTGFILERLRTRQAYFLAMGLFTLGTVIAAVAPGFGVLLLGRVVQATGTAIMMPLLMTTILTLVPMNKRGMVMGNITIAMSVAPALGPTVSGVILEHFEWRFMFIFVLPVAIVALLVGAKYLVNVGEPGQQRLDMLSVLLTIPAFGGVVYGLSQIGGGHGGQAGPSTGAIVALAVGAIAMGLFVWRQLVLQRAGAPLLDLRAFNHRMFTVSVLLLVVAMVALFGTVILLPLFLQKVLGAEPLVTGLVMLPGGLAMGLSGPFIGRMYDKIGPRPLTVTGSVLMVLCLWQFAMMNASTPIWYVTVIQTVLNFSLALLFTPAFTNGLNPLPPQLYSHGSAILGTLQQVAGAAGTALLVALFAAGTALHGDLLDGTRIAFLTASGVAVLAVVLSAMMRRTEGAGHH